MPAAFHSPSVADQLFRFVAHFPTGTWNGLGTRVFASFRAQCEGFANQLPCQTHIVMPVDQQIQSVRSQFWQDSSRMSQTNRLFTGCQQPLRR